MMMYTRRVTNHYYEAQPAASNSLPNVHIRAIRVIAASPVQQIFHSFVARENDHCFRAKYQGVHGTIEIQLMST